MDCPEGRIDLHTEGRTVQFREGRPAGGASSLAILRLLSPHALRWIWKGLLRPGFPESRVRTSPRPQSSHGQRTWIPQLQTSVLGVLVRRSYPWSGGVVGVWVNLQVILFRHHIR